MKGPEDNTFQQTEVSFLLNKVMTKLEWELNNQLSQDYDDDDEKEEEEVVEVEKETCCVHAYVSGKNLTFPLKCAQRQFHRKIWSSFYHFKH